MHDSRTYISIAGNYEIVIDGGTDSHQPIACPAFVSRYEDETPWGIVYSTHTPKRYERKRRRARRR